jgi:hypothetical protein
MSISVGEMPSIHPDSSRRGHSQPAFEVHHVTQCYQSCAMLDRDHGRGVMHNRVSNLKQGCELFTGEYFCFWGHTLSMDRFGNPLWSILHKQRNKGRLSWPAPEPN